MPDIPFEIVPQPEPEELRFLEQQIIHYNLETTGIRDGKVLACFVRDGEGRILGGITGWTWGGCCQISNLWVHQDQRGRGLGSGLLQAAEREATARGCRQILLDRHSFQAPEFYRKQGYEVVGIVQDYPPGHQKLYLRKSLNGEKDPLADR